MQAGLDLGSVATKCVVVDGGRVLARVVVRTGADPRRAGEEACARAFEAAGVALGDVPIVTTGYGRRAVEGARRVLPEIQAAARGAHALLPRAEVVLDVGGQDTKAVRADGHGGVADFAMNDKCAAGTGRFLEMMAMCMEVPLGDLGRLALESSSPATINATCAVFAESEVVSLVARGVPRSDIAAGLHAAIASRVAVLARQVGAARRYAFAGGGAMNPALRAAIEARLGVAVEVPEHPQFLVALGAALSA
jgi:predicted CoA-substrate-specific enzyme activase